MAVEDTKVEETQEQPWAPIELEAETVAEVRTKLITENPDKTEEDLADQIAAELSATKKGIYDQQQADLAQIDAVKAIAGNEKLTDEEAWAIFLQNEGAGELEDEDLTSIFDTKEAKDPAAKGADAPELREQRIAEFEAVLKDPLIADIVALRKSGGSVEQFLASFGQVKNFSAMKPKEILREGIAMYKELGHLSDEEAERELDRIEDLGAIESISMAKTVLVDLESAQRTKMSKYISQNTPDTAVIEGNKKKAESELLNLSLRVTEKPYHGVNLTKGDVAKLVEEIKSGKLFYNEDGSPKVEVFLEAAIWKSRKADILKAQVEKAKQKGVLAERKKRMMPSRSSAGLTTRMPGSTDKDASYKIEREKLKKKN